MKNFIQSSMLIFILTPAIHATETQPMNLVDFLANIQEAQLLCITNKTSHEEFCSNNLIAEILALHISRTKLTIDTSCQTTETDEPQAPGIKRNKDQTPGMKTLNKPDQPENSFELQAAQPTQSSTVKKDPNLE